MPKKSILRIGLLFLLVTIVLAGCGAAEPVASPVEATPVPAGPFVLTDGLDRPVEFEKPAQKIVSIAPSNTEIVFAIGAGAQLVGRDEFSDYPEAAKSLPSVGGGFGALDTETLIALQPDLVLASELTPPEQVAALEKLGLKVYLLANPLDLEGMLENLRLVGQITGKQAEAQALLDQLASRIKDVDEKLAQATEKPLVFYQLDSTDPNAPWTAGAGSFIDTLINRAGGLNLGGKLKDAYAQISIEQLLVEQPAVILVGDYTWGGVTAEAVLARDSWSGIEAIKNQQVFIFDDNLISRPGPRMVDGLESMARLLHPELFK